MAIDPLLNTKKTLGELSNVSLKYEGILTKMGSAVERFMTSQKSSTAFMRRVIYSFRGAYSVLNKINVTFRTTGKIYDKTIGAMMDRNSLLGKSMKGLSKIKMPNFAKGLGGMLSGAKGVASMAQAAPYGRTLETLGAGVKKRASEGFSKRGDQVIPFIKKQVERGKKVGKFLKGIDWTKKAKGLYFGVGQLLKVVLSKAFNFFIITILALVAIGAFVKVFWTAVQGFYNGFMQPFEGFFESIGTAFTDIWEGVQTIFSFFTGDASLQDMIFAVLDIAFAFIKITLEFLTRFLLALLNGVVSAGEALVMGVLDWLGNLSFWKQTGIVVALVGAVVLWLFSVPVIIPVIILGALYMFGKWFIKKFDILAGGGTVSSPLQLVGERGPEIVNLPKGSQVFSNKKSRGMVNNSGTQINNYITINARDTSDGEMRRIASKIGDMVNNKINRSTSSRTMG
tara:strand:- start:1313 stop:2674 length:1362 start_codon:yes stop_codon:yes gene_type:complete